MDLDSQVTTTVEPNRTSQDKPRPDLHLPIHDDARRHRRLFFMGLLVVSTVAVMAMLTFVYRTLPYDLDTTATLQGIRFAPFHHMMLLVSRAGYLPGGAILLLAALSVVARSLGWRQSAFLFSITVFQGVANWLIKSGIGRPRPTDDLVEVLFVSQGLSFPSGHVMFYTVFFGFLFYLSWTHIAVPLLRWLALVLTGGPILLVGPSRIYLGVHWLSDVIAAYLLGLVILFFGIEFYLKYIVAESEEGLNRKAAPPK